MRRHTLRVCALACVLFGSSVASAQESPAREAEAHFRRGVELSDARNPGAARVEFARAYELSRDPRMLYNLGATHLALGDFVAALEAFQRFLDESPADAVAAQRPTLDPAMAHLRELLGTVVITLDTPSLTVRIDDVARDARRARAGLPVSSGRHRVALAAPHFVAREDVVDLASGQRLVISEALAAEQSGLTVACDVSNVEVFVDGALAGRTPLASLLAVSEGTHRVELRRAGYAPYSTVVEATRAGARVEATLAWSASLADDVGARLRVEASEPDVVATLDGRRVAIDGSERVPPGPHRLRVARANFLTVERDVTLAPGALQVERVALLPTPAHRSALLATAREARRNAWVVTAVGAAALVGGAVGVVLTTQRIDALTDDRAAALSAIRQCANANPCTYQGGYMGAQDRVSAINDNELPPMDAARIASISVGALGLVGVVVGAVMHARAPSTSHLSVEASVSPHGEGARMGLAYQF